MAMRTAPFPRVMLARMAPGGVIHPHQDANPAAKWPHKIHVPIVTNDQVIFHVDGVGYHFGEGDGGRGQQYGDPRGRPTRAPRIAFT